MDWTCGPRVREQVFTGIQMGQFERKRPLGNSRNKWEGNFKMDLQETEWLSMDYIRVGLDRSQWRSFVEAVTNLRLTCNAVNFFTGSLSLVR